MEANLTVFFNIDTDGVDAQYLHSIIVFSEPDGDGGAIYRSMFDGVLFAIYRSMFDWGALRHLSRHV